MKKLMIVLFSLLIIIAAGCSQSENASVPRQETEKPHAEPEPVASIPQNEVISWSISEDISKILAQSSRVSSISYSYKGPENENEVYKFYVKDNKIKYEPPTQLQSLDLETSYDSVFLDSSSKTAEKYCNSAACKFRGKKESLEYSKAYIMTPFDWIEGITRAEKIGEEKIENRNTWKISTNNGMIWVDSYYGIAFRAESEGKTYRYSQIAFNTVKDSDVVPFDKQ